ncbi:hypothetical protein, partial [Pontibacterium sp.]|uniref:hypothetical protein n=1 Tax=Pontibacterium sp. TaxID=2036026 RepID=UPI0035696CE4
AAGVQAATAASVLAIEDIEPKALTADVVEILSGGGISQLQYVGGDLGDDTVHGFVTATGDACTDTNLGATVASRSNAVVAGNIFMTPKANGCGFSHTLADTDLIAVWKGGYERVMGQAGTGFDSAAAFDSEGNPALLAVGLGPSSTLFNANQLGGMTTVPVYRHVSETEYNRFVALFNIGTYGAAGVLVAGEQATLAAIVDGAGDTKEEELGEWDGTRNTI